MKKIIAILTIPLLILVLKINVFAAKNEKEIYFDDMNTLNFIEKSGYLPLHSIEQICSLDYCDIVIGENVNQVLNNFTNRYLKYIKNEEDKVKLKVKGIKITRLIISN